MDVVRNFEVGVIGGSGALGKALCARLATAGHRVVAGCRDKDLGESVIDSVRRNWMLADSAVIVDTLKGAANAEIVIVAVPSDAIVDVTTELANELADKTVISAVNPLEARNGELFGVVGSSAAETIASVLPNSNVATAFNHLPAGSAVLPEVDLDADVFVCADNGAAVEQTCELIRSIEGLRPVYCGSLLLSSAIEGFSAVLINANHHGMKRTSVKLTEQRLR